MIYQSKMEIIDKEKYDNIDELPEEEEEEEIGPDKVPFISEEDVSKLKDKFNYPLEEMKELAVKIKFYLTKKMKEEFQKNSFLTESTRKWIKEYNDLLDRIQKGTYGERSVSITLGKVTHTHIAAMMREYKDIPPKKEPEKKKNSREKKKDEKIIEAS